MSTKVRMIAVQSRVESSTLWITRSEEPGIRGLEFGAVSGAEVENAVRALHARFFKD